MAQGHRRTYVTIALLVALVLAAAAAAACSARATAVSSPLGTGSSAAPSGSPGTATGAKAAPSSDWSRVLAALAYMQADTPTKPVVVLLGGSAARESTISDESWRTQIVDKGGPATLAWNMGSGNRTMAQNVAVVKKLPKGADVVVLIGGSAARESTISDESWRSQIVGKGGPDTLAWNMGSGNRTMAQNVAVVKKLPKGAHAIVFIGINLGAFTSSQKTAKITLPSPAPTSVPLRQPHSYGVDTTGILSAAKKKALLQNWLATRYPVFKRNFANSAAVLETLIKTCQTRGYKPVLFELPRNTQIIGGSLKAPTTKFRDKCKALASKYKIPWVSQVSAAKLPSTDFYDLWHLVEPGRTVWQDLLSAKTAALLTKYGYGGGGS